MAWIALREEDRYFGYAGGLLMAGNCGPACVEFRMRLMLTFLAAIAAGGVARGQSLAVVNATVYASPRAPAEPHATVLIQGGRVAAVGHAVRVPKGVRTLECGRCVVFAGFWNTHVHLTGRQWAGAGEAPAARLGHELEAMLTHSGFTTVVDTASDPENTVALRRRVESGEVPGPLIYTAGFALYPPHGIPFYLDDLSPEERAKLQTPPTPVEALRSVERNMSEGSDVVKLFTGSYLSPDQVTHMPVAIARVAVSVAHHHGQLVFAHPSDLEGVRIAMDSGVDVLAHAPDSTEGIDAELIKAMVAHHLAMTPTLKLFSGSDHIGRIREIVREFHKEGGVLLFGTDTGFLTDYDVTEEYRQLKAAGLSFRDVLAMLTTNPASEFRAGSHAGSIKVGGDGDLTILGADPGGGDLRNFGRVLYTIRRGRVIFDGTGR